MANKNMIRIHVKCHLNMKARVYSKEKYLNSKYLISKIDFIDKAIKLFKDLISLKLFPVIRFCENPNQATRFSRVKTSKMFI